MGLKGMKAEMPNHGTRANDDEVWFWYCHIMNAAKGDLKKSEYCRLYNLDKVKYGNMRYLIYYCSSTSPLRYQAMLKHVQGYHDSSISVTEYAKKYKLKITDFHAAIRHVAIQGIIQKRIADNHPVLDFSAKDSEPLDPVIPDDNALDMYAAPEEELLSNTDIPSLSEFQGHPESNLAFMPEIDLKEESEPIHEPELEPAFSFISVNPHLKKPESDASGADDTESSIVAPEVAPPSIPEHVSQEEPKVIVKGHRIEFTFTKSVTVGIPEDLSDLKLTRLINLLKDL